MRTELAAVVLSVLFAVPALARNRVADPSSDDTEATSPPRKARDRTVTITDANANELQELFVAAGNGSRLIFNQPLATGNEAAQLLNPKLFFPVQQTEKSVTVVPKKDLRPGQAISLTVTLADGTSVPFKLVTDPKAVDWQVQVVVSLDQKAAPDSPQALKALTVQLQNRLEDCQSQSGEMGLRKIGQLLVNEDLDKPQAFIVERRELHWRDKQNRLLVTVRQIYRLLGTSYLVLTVRNRDTKIWVLDKTEVKVPGSGNNTDVKVLDTVAEQSSLQPDQEEKLVVIFTTPALQSGQKYDVQLLEKNGSRHALLEGLAL